MEFYCRECFAVIEILRAVPPLCPQCQCPGHWKAIPDLDTPTRPYHLNEDDYRFLRVNKIDPEDA